MQKNVCALQDCSARVRDGIFAPLDSLWLLETTTLYNTLASGPL